VKDGGRKRGCTLPYKEFQNKDKNWNPGRSYAHSDVIRLVHIKYAIQNGIHILEPDLTEDELLQKGAAIYGEQYVLSCDYNNPLGRLGFVRCWIFSRGTRNPVSLSYILICCMPMIIPTLEG
jgi:hypothetical protein